MIIHTKHRADKPSILKKYGRKMQRENEIVK